VVFQMSGETQHRPTVTGTGIVLPEPVSDKGIMESVTGFISDVVPQVSSGAATDGRDVVSWLKFEDTEDSDTVLLVLGYSNGVQVWAITGSGEAKEALSWRRGVVRTLRVLLNPEPDNQDSQAHKRPLVALCDSSGSNPFCTLSFVSLRIGDQVKIVKYKNQISDVVCSRRVVVVTFPEKLAILDAGSLEEIRSVLTCYPVSGPNLNPIALGTRWLAYADKHLSTNALSAGGVESFAGQSVTATVLHAAKSLGKAVASSLTGQRTSAVSADLHPGVVSILDVLHNAENEVSP